MDKGEKSLKDIFSTNKEYLSKDSSVCCADATGVACELDEDDSGEMDNYGLLLSDLIE